jgi:hypothetical protein
VKDHEEAELPLLRHTLATVAYRGAKVLRDVPPDFAGLRISPTSRTPCEILAHIGDLLEWALSMARGRETWQDTRSTDWPSQVERFFSGLARLDECLSSQSIHCSPERLFQGPVADALTHIGQLAMLRRVGGAPVKGENYFRADIEMGSVGASQPPPEREFE